MLSTLCSLLKEFNTNKVIINTHVCLCLSSVLLKGLQELMASSQTSSGPGSPSSSSLQIRLTRLEESGGSPSPSSVAALQIPVQIPLQITHLGETHCRSCSVDLMLKCHSMQTMTPFISTKIHTLSLTVAPFVCLWKLQILQQQPATVKPSR